MNKYVDAGVFIQAALRKDKNCICVLQKILSKEFVGVTSVLSWDEISFILKKFVGAEIGLKEGEKFLIFPNLVLIDAKKETIVLAQKLSRKYNLNPRDAIHAATAIKQGVEEIISEDTDFDKIEELKRINPKKFCK